MIRSALPLLIGALLLTPACGRHEQSGPIDVSVIGAPFAAVADPDRATTSTPDAILATATSQGLLRYDAAGQIVPGLAARWIVSENGRSLIFRLPDTANPAALPVSSETIARRLRAAIAPASRNPLKPLLGAITDIDAVTPQVIDIELAAPRPNLLQLFAQPELGVATRRGGGPFATIDRKPGLLTLRERPDPAIDRPNTKILPTVIRLRSERAGVAVARFMTGDARLVLGGGFADLPVARAAALPRGALHFDPVSGLFGLAFTHAESGFTADAANRRALAMAIDRDRIARLLAVPGWFPATGIVARGTPEIAVPSVPDWSASPIVDRQAEARRIVFAGNKAPTPLRIAMPAGPGARLLFASIAADWRAIGVAAIAVGQGEPADLRLIDEVAPADTAAFYLRSFACERNVPCTPESDTVLIGARAAPSLPRRTALLAQADSLIAQIAPFIALGPPIRWSLVTPDLDLYRDSPRAIHPLNELRTPSKR
jgi:oligopeptide transport system substrate-binding protein